jgi:hypothetical protein
VHVDARHAVVALDPLRRRPERFLHALALGVWDTI